MKRILIIDDDHAIVDLIAKAVAGEDRTIRYAFDGEAALKWIVKEVFDLAICDLMMPRKHGLQVMRKIRENPEAVRTRILVLTAKSFNRDVEKALASGADAVMIKPFDLGELQIKVSQLLS
jgi:DNA-binding response OmpR family regulator